MNNPITTTDFRIAFVNALNLHQVFGLLNLWNQSRNREDSFEEFRSIIGE